MYLVEFFDPAQIQDTPRFFTAIAEWLAVFVYFNIYKRRHHDKVFVFLSVITLFLFVGYQFVAGLMPLTFWIPCMIGAVGLIYCSLYFVLDIKPKDCGVLTTHAFVLAEFAASLYKQMFVWFVAITGQDGFVESFIAMLVIFALTYIIYFQFERGNIAPDRNLNINNIENEKKKEDNAEKVPNQASILKMRNTLNEEDLSRSQKFIKTGNNNDNPPQELRRSDTIKNSKKDNLYYSYECTNNINLVSYIYKGTSSTKIDLILKNDGTLEWDENSKLIFDILLYFLIFSSNSIIFLIYSSNCSIFTKNPFFSFSIKSSIPLHFKATTGFPAANASIMFTGNPSLKLAETTISVIASI